MTLSPNDKSYLKELLDSAESHEDLAAVEKLVADAERGAAKEPARPARVKSQQQAADMLGVARPRLRDWELNAPWWKPEFRIKPGGYDVAAIAKAQAEFHGKPQAPAPADNWVERTKKAKALEAELELEERLYEFQKKKKNILPADVYASFTRELLGMIRKRLEEIPLKVMRNVAPAAKAAIINTKGNAPLQREIEKLITDVEEWLKKSPEDDSDATD
ncbi:MAG: hypothetical protein JNL58_04395 [Planctomyces sp.]|nr:hypothetical protein [Planctomyces sp.]